MSAPPAFGRYPTAPTPSVDRSEAQLAALARARGPLRRVLAALAARLTGQRAFEPLGFARLGDYSRERLGISARSVQELARVGRRLAARPRLEAALVSGALPWSKIRLLARGDSAEDEAQVIAQALRTSVRDLERELRRVNRGALCAGARADALEVDEEGAHEEATVIVAVGAPAALHFKWRRTCRYAARVCGEATPPGTVLEWVTTEALAALPGCSEEEAQVGKRLESSTEAEIGADATENDSIAAPFEGPRAHTRHPEPKGQMCAPPKHEIGHPARVECRIPPARGRRGPDRARPLLPRPRCRAFYAPCSRASTAPMPSSSMRDCSPRTWSARCCCAGSGLTAERRSASH